MTINTIETQTAKGSWLRNILNRQSIALIVLLLAGFALRIYGITDRGIFNTDLACYARQAAFIDELFKWRLVDNRPATDFAEHVKNTPALEAPSLAKPLHLEFHRLGHLVMNDYFDSISLMGAIFGTFNILLVWILVRRLTDDKLFAFLSAFFLCISGYNVFYAGRGYNHADATMFSLLAALSLQKFWGRPGDYGYQFLYGVALGAAAACHYNVLIILPVAIVFGFAAPSVWRSRFISSVLTGTGFLSVLCIIQGYYLWMHGYYPEMKTYFNQFFQTQVNSAPGTAMDFKSFFDYFLMNFELDGYVLTFLAFAGAAVFTVRNLKRIITFKWIDSGPLLYLTAIMLVSFTFWGCYNYKIPRTQVFVTFTFPVMAAYALVALLRLGKNSPLLDETGKAAKQLFAAIRASVCVLLLTVIGIESTWKSIRQVHIGRGHRITRTWLIANHRKPLTGYDAMGFEGQPSGSAKLWYVDAAELIQAGKVDCLAIDYPIMFHNFIYNQATHPGAPQFAMKLIEVLNNEHVAIFQADYVEPWLSQLESGRMWHLKFSAEQPLSKFIRVYDGKDVMAAYQKVIQRYYQKKQ